MRLNGVRFVIASCTNCGRSTDVNVDLLPETLTVPGLAGDSAAAAAAVTRSRPDPLGIRAHSRAFLTIGANGRRCHRPATATARPALVVGRAPRMASSWGRPDIPRSDLLLRRRSPRKGRPGALVSARSLSLAFGR